MQLFGDSCRGDPHGAGGRAVAQHLHLACTYVLPASGAVVAPVVLDSQPPGGAQRDLAAAALICRGIRDLGLLAACSDGSLARLSWARPGRCPCGANSCGDEAGCADGVQLWSLCPSGSSVTVDSRCQCNGACPSVVDRAQPGLGRVHL